MSRIYYIYGAVVGDKEGNESVTVAILNNNTYTAVGIVQICNSCKGVVATNECEILKA